MTFTKLFKNKCYSLVPTIRGLNPRLLVMNSGQWNWFPVDTPKSLIEHIHRYNWRQINF